MHTELDRIRTLGRSVGLPGLAVVCPFRALYILQRFLLTIVSGKKGVCKERQGMAGTYLGRPTLGRGSDQ